MSWETTIRTGDPNADLRALEEARAHAQTQGLVVQASPLPQGGWHVRAMPPAAMAYAPPASAGYAAPGHVPAGAGQCQLCGRAAATKQVTLMRNIGCVVLRFPRTIRGALCRHCIDKYFWEYTTVSFFLGWWGIISFFTTLVAIPANVVAFFGSRNLPFPPEDQMSLADKRSRGMWMSIVGGVGALLAVAWIMLCALAILGSEAGEDVGALVVMLVLGTLFALGPAIWMLVAGLQTRARASVLAA
jgi:hypothetical protein